MSYVEEVMQQIGERHQLDPLLIRLYALLVLAKGEATTMEDVHDAWSLWQDTTQPDHHSVVPFYMLRPEVQVMDKEYRDTIVDIAKQRTKKYSRSDGIVCARCKIRTGNNNQGHYWSGCRVTKKLEKFHFCCPADCELFNQDGSPRPVTITDNVDYPEVPRA